MSMFKQKWKTTAKKKKKKIYRAFTQTIFFFFFFFLHKQKKKRSIKKKQKKFWLLHICLLVYLVFISGVMYNGIESISVKGSGLSGYVQRSKAAISQLSKFIPAEYLDDVPPAAVNPLESLRSAKENAELATRLTSHQALRRVKLKVLMYREERMAAGVAADVVERECQTLYESLMRNYREEVVMARRAEKKETALKDAERFASAFGVKHAAVGDAFDRARREAERRAAEMERRRAVEEKIAERVKRVRGDEE